jgi:hypothetical protein
MPQVATNCIILSSSWWWALWCPKNVEQAIRSAIKIHLLHLVGILFLHINDDARSKSHEIHWMLGCGRYYPCRLSFVNQCSLKIVIINSRNILVQSSIHGNQWNLLCSFWVIELMRLFLLHGRCILWSYCVF